MTSWQRGRCGWESGLGALGGNGRQVLGALPSKAGCTSLQSHFKGPYEVSGYEFKFEFGCKVRLASNPWNDPGLSGVFPPVSGALSSPSSVFGIFPDPFCHIYLHPDPHSDIVSEPTLYHGYCFMPLTGDSFRVTRSRSQ